MFYELSRFLYQMGFVSTHNGYDYSRRAILLSIKDPRMLKRITSELYPTIADYFEVSPSSVERCIRNSIESAWLRGSSDFNYELFQNSIDFKRGKPTNSEFLAVVSEYFRMNYCPEELRQAVDEELGIKPLSK